MRYFKQFVHLIVVEVCFASLEDDGNNDDNDDSNDDDNDDSNDVQKEEKKK
jgi:hypothetical protein